MRALHDPRRPRARTAAAAAAALLAGALLLAGAGPAPASAQTATAPPGAGKVDLNSAPLEIIETLPVAPELARRIVDFRTYERFFDDVYDLLDVEGVTAADLERLKPLVATLPPREADASMARLEASYRQVREYLGQEGSNEGLVDEYLDQLREPVNVNRLDLFELMSYQNVSPVDATRILESRKRLGAFGDARQLRQSDGLRYYAFRNLRDFVTYNDPDSAAVAEGRIRGSWQLKYYDTPYMQSDAEFSGGQILTEYGDPFLMQKVRLDLGGGFKAGLLAHRNMQEGSWHETVKGFYGFGDKQFGGLRLKRMYLGNYRVAFGLGLVMDNTDFMLFRKTGYGWNVRPIGVRGDLSRTREFALTGGAVEGSYGPLHGTFFASTGHKDGILNDDDDPTLPGDQRTVNQYILMYPRLSEGYLRDYIGATGTGLRRNAFREDILGGNLKLLLGEGTYVGVTGYEARYNRAFRADVNTLIPGDEQDLLDARDSEIWQGYTSVRARADGSTTRHQFRRVYGADFQAVVDNVALQGEYAVLQDPDASLLHGANRDAYVVNGYAQWDDLHLLAIYRDYDVGFDNPYNRAFCNDARYEQTLLDNDYRLNDPYYYWLSANTAQPKPEKGLFLQTRYRISRTLTITGLEYDQWERKADGMDMRRYTLRAEYQPIFNLRFRVRHRYSSRGEQIPSDVREYRNWETRWELMTLLSNYNSLRLMYMTSNVMFPPRPRLNDPAEVGPDESALGTAAIPAHAFQAIYEHNLTPGIRLLLSTEMYDGFLWNFEGDEFVTLDGRGFRNWFQVESRVSDRLLWHLKVTRDHNLPRTYLDLRRYGEAYGNDPDATYVPRDQLSFRWQLDYTF